LVEGKPVKFTAAANGPDTVCAFDATVRRRATVEVVFEGGVEIDVPAAPAQLGDRTSSLKVIEVQAPAADRLRLRLEGLAGRSYPLRVRGGLNVQRVEGGEIRGEEGGWRWIEVAFPLDRGDGYQSKSIELSLK
jgi:hypothetical protein